MTKVAEDDLLKKVDEVNVRIHAACSEIRLRKHQLDNAWENLKSAQNAAPNGVALIGCGIEDILYGLGPIDYTDSR